MAERGDGEIPPEDGEGRGNQGYDKDDDDDGGFYATPEEWERYMKIKEEEDKKREQKNDADKYKDKVSEKTYNRWTSQEERQGSQEKKWTWDDNQSYEDYKKHHDYLLMKDRDGTTRSSTTKEKKVETTSFGGTMTLEMIDAERNLVEEEALRVFPNMDKNLLPRIKFDMYGRLVYKGDKTFKDGVDHNLPHIIAEGGRPSHDYDLSTFPKGLKGSLGKSNVLINYENLEKQRILEEQNEKMKQVLDELRIESEETNAKLVNSRGRLEELGGELEECEKILQGYPTIQEAEEVRRRLPQIKESIKVEREKVRGNEQDLARLRQDITRQETGVRNGQEQVEAARERVDQRLLPLRERVKEIFKKHGFTVVAVATAIGTVIGVIVSNLKAGLTKVAKGVGNGLKELGAKLGQILPGMVGAIASFIFKTAGEAIGFLAKNAWLLIVGLVVLAVEQFKKKG